MTEVKEAKKGRKSWKPSALLAVHGIPEGYVPRWVDTSDEMNKMRRFGNEGYVPLSSVTNTKAGHVKPGHIGDGKQLTTVTEYRGMTLCVTPKEDFDARREYYTEQTQRQTAGLREEAERRNRAKSQTETAARLYGKTIIE